jgi:fatty acid desaturase
LLTVNPRKFFERKPWYYRTTFLFVFSLVGFRLVTSETWGAAFAMALLFAGFMTLYFFLVARWKQRKESG